MRQFEAVQFEELLTHDRGSHSTFPASSRNHISLFTQLTNYYEQLNQAKLRDYKFKPSVMIWA